jgi:hypothetical protein
MQQRGRPQTRPVATAIYRFQGVRLRIQLPRARRDGEATTTGFSGWVPAGSVLGRQAPHFRVRGCLLPELHPDHARGLLQALYVRAFARICVKPNRRTEPVGRLSGEIQRAPARGEREAVPDRPRQLRRRRRESGPSPIEGFGVRKRIECETEMCVPRERGALPAKSPSTSLGALRLSADRR